MITVLFTCSACGLRDVAVKVRDRPRETDVIAWMRDAVIPAVARRHTVKSLLCESKTIDDIKIPFDDTDADGWLGKQTDLVPPQGAAP